jgi:hypothetical protein
MAALREGQIEPADLAVLLAIVQSFEFMGRRSWAEWSDLVQLTGLPEEAARAAAGRLLAAELVACGRDADRPSWWHWKLSPLLVTDCRGTRQADARVWAEWRELVASGARPDDRVSGTRLRALRQRAREREQLEAAAGAELAAAHVAERELVMVAPAREIVAALAPAAPAAPARGRRRPVESSPGSPAGGGEQQLPPAQARVQPAAPPAPAAPAGRVVSIRPSDAHRAADLEWRRQSEERRRQRQQKVAAS